MRWLLWKDYRHNRLIVFAGLAILLLPYLVGLGIGLGGRWYQIGTHDGQPVYWTPDWRAVLAGSCAWSIVLSQFTFALLGGNAISGERVDRSAAFLYSLPFTRRRLLASKLLLTLAIAAVIWLTTILVWACLMPREVWARLPSLAELLHSLFTRRAFEGLVALGTIPITGLTFFCVAWFLSSYVASPAFDVCGGFVTPLLVLTGYLFVNWLLAQTGWHAPAFDGRTFALWYSGICLTIMPVCFAVGTWHYLRRVEP
jgi:hypothetical protein